MEINLIPIPENSETIDTNYPAPCSSRMKREMRELQNYYGGSVNQELREHMQRMIDTHKKNASKNQMEIQDKAV